MRIRHAGRSTPRKAAVLLASGAIEIFIAALVGGRASIGLLVVGAVLFGAGAVALGRWPNLRRR